MPRSPAIRRGLGGSEIILSRAIYYKFSMNAADGVGDPLRSLIILILLTLSIIYCAPLKIVCVFPIILLLQIFCALDGRHCPHLAPLIASTAADVFSFLVNCAGRSANKSSIDLK